MKSFFTIILFAVVCFYISSNTYRDRKENIFTWDKSGYHLHLPALFIYHDVSQLKFYSHIDDVHQPTGVHRDYCLMPLENGNRINRYNIGVAVHELPFFLAAHFINTNFLDYEADGYTPPYDWGAICSTIFWVVCGLFALRRFLLRYFSDTVTTITVLAIAFGTNLYYYSVFGTGMSHSYSFFDFAMVVLLTDSIYRKATKLNFALLGIVMGLIAITRSTNLLVVIIPLLWGVSNKRSLMERIRFFKDKLSFIILGGISFMAVVMLQMGYWKYITGHWLYDGYANEGFIWTEPMIWRGLFGFQKGWFVYTPVALFMIWGLYSMRKRFAGYIPAIVLFMTINIYVIFSWWNWWYGGGFGCRPLVEATAVLALPFAAFTEQVINRKNVLITALSAIALSFLIFLNMFQSYQLYKTVFHWEKMSKAYYFRVFMKEHAAEDDGQYLLSDYELYLISDHRLQQLNKKK